MSITTETAAEANEQTAKSLDRIAGAVQETGYLVGGRFSAADLTAASLRFLPSFPSQLPFSMPFQASDAMDHWKSRWGGHPAVRWMEEIYATHR